MDFLFFLSALVAEIVGTVAGFGSSTIFLPLALFHIFGNIGRGEILSRLNSLDREEWDFDIIEYSKIEDPIKQSKWESYWLDKFVEKEGKLPVHNKINGKKSKDE